MLVAHVEERSRKRRGFALIPKDLVVERGRAGARSAHARGKAHRFSSEEARVAGRKGGLAKQRKVAEGALCPTCGTARNSDTEPAPPPVPEEEEDPNG